MFRILKHFVLATLFAVFASQTSAMFIQADWLDPTEPGVGTNRYSYSNNDPINKFDPMGNSYTDPNASLEDTEPDNEPDENNGILDNITTDDETEATEDEIETAQRRSVRPGQPQSPQARFEAMRDQNLRSRIDRERARLGLPSATYAQPPNFQPNTKTNNQLQQQLNVLQGQRAPLGTTTPTTRDLSRAPKTALPNSIHEQYNSNGVLSSRTMYDGNGRPFSRQDFSHPHGGMQPHEHNLNLNGHGLPVGPSTVTPLNGTGWQ